MEDNDNNSNQNSAINIINKSEIKILNKVKSEIEDFEEDDTETPIIRREIKSCITTPYTELKMSKDENLNYNIIRFDLDFYSSNNKYSWKVYHTPKEILYHIKKIYDKIRNKQLLIKSSINPIIINLKVEQDVLNNLQIINNFYAQLFTEPNVQNQIILNSFFNIGGTSFLKQNDGDKPFEGYVEKKVDKHCFRKCFSYICPCLDLLLMKRYNKRWVVVNNDHLFYMNKPTLKEGKVVYFFDKDTKIENDGEERIKIKNSSMSLNLKFKNFFEKEYWKNELERRNSNYKLLLSANEYSSYTNMKRFNLCQWFVDGKDYFEDLYHKLLEAKYSIYITDWWMSPELFLLRPVDEKPYINMAEKKLITRRFGNNMKRLMDVLDYKARQGVKVYILIYYECSLALTLNSSHTEEAFKKINPNIIVTRHPSGPSTLLWTHHEKLVIIDQMIGYVGGLDLCWGRYDNNNHPIYEPPNPQGIYEFPLIDYSNARICDFSNVEDYTKESVSRKDTMRMPWHDVHSRIIGPAVSDIARHFIERWNHANFSERSSRGLTSINQRASISQNKFNFWQKFSDILQKNKSIIEDTKQNNIQRLDTIETLISSNKKIGEEKNKKIFDDFMKGKKKIDDDHLYERDDSKITSSNTTAISQKPRYYQQLVKSIGKKGNKILALDDDENEIYRKDMYKEYFKPGCITSSVQVLRSSSEWSAGLSETENSILKAYYQLIENSKHYILIENQFFISKAWTDEEMKNCKYSISDIVQNEIALYLRRRIEKAYKNKENFKVFIFLPLIPGFEGEPENSPTLQIILKHTYASICRNHRLSLTEKLYELMGSEWKNYIGFYSLRNHGLINNVPKTELIYIHSKLMIIDDTKVLIGSANINDRSMLGNRDSEFAVIIKEKRELINRINGKNFIMNGVNHNAAHFAVTFRKALMAEYLGISKDDPILDDPVSFNLHQLFINRARINTRIYHEIFGCYPHDSYTNIGLLKAAQKIKENEKPELLLKKYMDLKNQIIGHIVEFPLQFLKEEELGISFFSKENLVPEYNFT